MALLLAYVIVINVTGLCIMLLDKRRARLRKYRISETMIWTVSMMGGALGSTIGMFAVRHKTKRLLFKFGLPCVSFVHIALVIYLVLNFNLID